MTDQDELRRKILELPPKRLALLALSLQETLERERRVAREPIAVVGMACRFPGGSDSADAYWRMMEQGIDAIREVPADRWPVEQLFDPNADAVGRVVTRSGGFLEDVQGFDAPFFAISPREARCMDPQQRLLMEVSWRAFEDAAIPPARLFGTKTGVFVGLCNNDYLTRLLKLGAEDIDLYYSSGNAYSVAAGRLSFTFGFQGPAITVDTACSSSLVALHEACKSLRAGESDVVLAAGANVMCSVETTMALSRSRALAPDGRCKTFDDAADGFARGEGCGVLILKRLSDAVRDGDRIHAVLRGTAIGQDGRSTGLTVPNGPAQEQVIREAIERSSLRPEDIDFIETHGTGTSLGDPIEVRALGRVFGRRAVPLYVGSVKTNIGHLESAAGVASLIKAILAVREGRIPPHLHFTTPNRHVEWDQFSIEVPAAGREWPATGRPRRAGVSSFGFSGTNAHVIVEQAPAPVARVASGAPELPLELLPVSGFRREARDGLATTYRDALAGLADDAFRDFCHTARVGRSAFGWRRALVARSAEEARASLAGEADAPLLLEGESKVSDPPQVAFLFTGQGAQSPGMGRSLYEHAPVFRAAIDRCAAILDPILPVPLRTALFEGEGDEAPIYRTTIAQPAVVAFEWALSELWRSWGVQPAAVLGHSLGEFVAACVAGVFSVEDMLRLVAERGRLLDTLPRGEDRMVAIFASAAVVQELIAGSEAAATIGAFNGPENTVVSGRADVVTRIAESCAARGIEHRELKLDRAYHSPRVEPMVDALHAFAATIPHHAPRLPVAWNVTGEVGGTAPPPLGYWREHVRRPVRFLQGVQGLAALGIRHFLEVGPHPTLSPLVAQILEREAPVLVPTLRRGGDSCRDALEALGRLWVAGVDVDFQALDQAGTRSRIPIPGHPFSPERYWVDPPAVQVSAAPRGVIPGVPLGAAVPIFETVLTPGAPAFLDEHRFRGDVVVPGPVYLESARAAARQLGHHVTAATDVQLLAPAVVTGAGLRLQTVIEQADAKLRFRVLSLPLDAGADARWSEHARGVLLAQADGAAPAVAEAPADGVAVSAVAHLERLRELGFELGPTAAPWTDLVAGERGGRARVVRPENVEARFASALLLDAAIQVLGAALARGGSFEPRMLAGMDEVVWAGDVDSAVSYAVILAPDGAIGGDAVLLDTADRPVAWLRGIRLAAVHSAADARTWHHRLEWRAAELALPEPAFDSGALAQAGNAVEAGWPAVAAGARLAEYVDGLPALERRATAHILRALVALGLGGKAGEALPADLADRLGIVPAHRRLFARLLDILGEAQLLARDGETWRVNGPLELAAVPAAGQEALDALVERCGLALADVLTGDADPLELLFPAGDRETTRAIYRDTAFGRAFNDALRLAVDQLAATRGERPLRILEAGAGSGATTLAALEALRGRSFRYLFTDLAPTLVHAAQAELGGTPGLEFRTLDLEADPVAQGIARGSQDLIIAANVVHATERIDRTLAHLARMLAPGGVLLLLEGTGAAAWVDITFGLTAGWWRFADAELRPSYPLLTRERWTHALERGGFAGVRAVPGDAVAHGAGQVILLAQKPPQPAIAAIQGSTLAAVLDHAGTNAGAAAERNLVFDGRARTPADLLRVMQQVIAGSGADRLWVVTEAAQAAAADEALRPGQAVLWGLARGFALEHPERWGGIIDVARGTADADVAHRVLGEIRSDGVEDQVAWRGNVRRVPRLVAEETPAEPLAAIAQGTYLVTGGLGGLGLKVARWLADRGARRLVLLGRSAHLDALAGDDPRRAQIEALERDGIAVVVRALDITDRAALAALLAELRADGPPIRGVVHAAAAFDAGLLAELTPERLDIVLAPKVAGTDALAEATAADPLDFMVLFSSTTSLLGVAGLASYAAANQYLDAFAASARARGRPVASIAWGIWDEMRLASRDEQERYAQAGLRPMASELALEGMARVLASGSANAVVANADWQRLRSVYEARRPRPMLELLGDRESDAAAARSAAGSAPSRLESLAVLPPEERRRQLGRLVEAEVREVLRLPDGRALDPAEGFFAMGMDSLMSVELKSRLEARLHTRLPATLTFNYPSTEAVVGFLEAKLEQAAQPAAEPAPAPPAPAVAATASAAAEEELDESALARLLESRLERLEQEGSAR